MLRKDGTVYSVLAVDNTMCKWVRSFVFGEMVPRVCLCGKCPPLHATPKLSHTRHGQPLNQIKSFDCFVENDFL